LLGSLLPPLPQIHVTQTDSGFHVTRIATEDLAILLLCNSKLTAPRTHLGNAH
jgi:hypothetical protein